jgi:hypothetical protein
MAAETVSELARRLLDARGEGEEEWTAAGLFQLLSSLESQRGLDISTSDAAAELRSLEDERWPTTEEFVSEDAKGKTAARSAVEDGNAAVLHLLHALGVPLDVRDSRGFNLAHAAATAGQPEILPLLCELAGPECLTHVDTEFGWTPAHAAASKGRAEVLRKLSALGAAETLTAVDKDGFVPAHVAAFDGNDGCLRALHELGAGESLGAVDHDGWTPAHAAASAGHVPCLLAMEELGASAALVQPDVGGRQPLDIAKDGEHASCVDVLQRLAPQQTEHDAAIANTTAITTTTATPPLLVAQAGPVVGVTPPRLAGGSSLRRSSTPARPEPEPGTNQEEEAADAGAEGVEGESSTSAGSASMAGAAAQTPPVRPSGGTRVQQQQLPPRSTASTDERQQESGEQDEETATLVPAQTEEEELAPEEGSGTLGKLIGGFLVCWVSCTVLCCGGAVALIVFGVLCLVEGPEVWTCDGGGDGGGSAVMLALGGVPVLLVVAGCIYLRADDHGWCRGAYIPPDGMAMRRKVAMLKRGAGMEDPAELSPRGERSPQQRGGGRGAASGSSPQQLHGPISGSPQPALDGDAGAHVEV